MASSYRVFGRTCRALMAAAKSPAGTPTATVAIPTTTIGAMTTTFEKRILKPRPISLALGEFLGTSEASINDAVTKIWDYIDLNNLENPANKMEIFCDAKLKTIFEGKDQVGLLEFARLLSQHFVKT